MLRSQANSLQAMECMAAWPLIQKNKVDDSDIEAPVKLLTESDNEAVAGLAKKVRRSFIQSAISS